MNCVRILVVLMACLSVSCGDVLLLRGAAQLGMLIQDWRAGDLAVALNHLGQERADCHLCESVRTAENEKSRTEAPPAPSEIQKVPSPFVTSATPGLPPRSDPNPFSPLPTASFFLSHFLPACDPPPPRFHS